MGNIFRLNIKSYCILLVIGIITFLCAYYSEWNDDAIAYSFFIPRFGEDESFAPIRNISDIWNSQINHYFNANGRFVVHFIVQIFCGLLSKTWFAIANALVWVLLIYNIASFKPVTPQFKTIAVASILSIFLFFPLAFTPPFQINYVWVSCAIVIWLKWFFSNKSKSSAIIILYAIASFLIGEMHEGFSIPVGGALLYYIISNKGKISLQKWILAGAFGIGACVTTFAPGNFWRIDHESSAESSSFALIEQIPTIIWFPLILLIFFLICNKSTSFKSFISISENKFLLIAACVSLIFNLYIGNLGRGIIPYNLFFILLSINYISGKNFSKGIIILGYVVASFFVAFKVYNIHMQNLKTREIKSRYSDSPSGMIFLPDELFLYNKVETLQRRNTYTNLFRQQDSLKPFLVIYPEAMTGSMCLKDTNAIIKIGKQSWICIQSASNPCNFVVKKTAFPSSLKKEMSPRILDFSSRSDIYIDSTENYRSILYTNDRNYIEADVVME